MTTAKDTMETLSYYCDDGVATLVLNRPQSKNALDATMTRELDELLVQITRDEALRCLVITGAGGAFCAGGDVRRMNQDGAQSPEQRRAQMRHAHRIVKALHALDRPVIAAVDGPAFGAGFSIALLADIILASDRARFCMAFGRIGLVPDYGSLYTLPRAVGLQRAREIMFSARDIGALEAKELGIALEVIPHEDLMARAMAMARAIANASPTAIAMTKDALQGSLESSLDSVLELEAAAQATAFSSAYAKDAFSRFAEKKPARFQWPQALRPD